MVLVSSYGATDMNRAPIASTEATEILAAYKAGVTITQIAKKYERQNCTVVRFLRREGVFVKKENWDKSSCKLTPQIIKSIGEAYAAGATQDALAARFGVSQTLVRNALEKAGVQARRRGKQTNFQRVGDGDAYCSGCDTRKPLDDFHFNMATNLPMYQCKECARWGRRAKVYGISKEQYDTMFKAQGGVCSCCGGQPDGTQRHPDLVVDHDHQTGVVRGLLCNRCNNVLGALHDKTREWGNRAADYLELKADDPTRLAMLEIIARLNPTLVAKEETGASI